MSDMWMPLMGTPFAVRMEVLDERRAQENHSQSLERLRQRGGISPCEASAIATDRDYSREGLEQSFAALIAASAPAQMKEGDV